MQLNHDDIQEFKEIYRQEFGEELSDVEAERRARQLLTFYEIIFQVLLKHPPRPDCESPAVDFETLEGILHDASPHSGLPSNPAASESAEAMPSPGDPHWPTSL